MHICLIFHLFSFFQVNQSTDKLTILNRQLERIQMAIEELSNAVDTKQLDKDIKDSELQRDK